MWDVETFHKEMCLAHTIIVMRLQKVILQSGMHQFPVKIGAMTRQSSTGLKNACPHCKAQVGKVNKCTGCDKQIESSELLKAFLVDEEMKVFNKEQVEALEGDTVIEILGKVTKSMIPKTRLMGGFLLRPDLGKKQTSKTGKPWECIRHALLNSDSALAVRYTNRGKERLAAITIENSEMVMLSLAFASDYSLPDEQPPSIEVTEKDIEQASAFVDSMIDVDLNSVIDERKSKVEEVAMRGETVAIQIKEKDDGMSFFS